MTGALVFVTDYGLEDGYAAQLRAAAWRVDPGARCVDGTHLVPAGDVATAAYRVKTLAGAFGPGSVICVVVDPGVGGSREAVALKCDGVLGVGPDTGLLTYLWTEAEQRKAVRLPAPAGASATFHGRDLFAPVAARLAAGAWLGDCGQGIASPHLAEWLLPETTAEGIRATIVCVDHFGNAITGIRRTDLRGGAIESIEWGRGGVDRLVSTYTEIGDGLAALWNSAGHLELAADRDSAAGLGGLSVGLSVLVRLR